MKMKREGSRKGKKKKKVVQGAECENNKLCCDEHWLGGRRI